MEGFDIGESNIVVKQLLYQLAALHQSCASSLLRISFTFFFLAPTVENTMLATLILALAASRNVAANVLAPRSCGEGTQKICYGVDGGESQDLNVDDIQYVAEYLRYIGELASGADKF